MEKGLKKFLFSSETSLSSFYDVRTIDFNAVDPDFDDSKPINSKKLEPAVRSLVYCTDVEALVFFLIMERLIDDENAIIKIGKLFNNYIKLFKIQSFIFQD